MPMAAQFISQRTSCAWPLMNEDVNFPSAYRPDAVAASTNSELHLTRDANRASVWKLGDETSESPPEGPPAGGPASSLPPPRSRARGTGLRRTRRSGLSVQEPARADRRQTRKASCRDFEEGQTRVDASLGVAARRAHELAWGWPAAAATASRRALMPRPPRAAALRPSSPCCGPASGLGDID